MSKNAFATIHFGSNPVYLELELYFFIMLRKYTKHDILYLYSVNDTPQSFVDAVRPLVDSVIPYDDKGITYDVKFESGYSNFNTLRTCNFIFAYTLEKYDKVCIIESDMVIMGNLDSVFKLSSPAVLTYHIGEKRLRENAKVVNTPEDAIKNCNEMGRTNGGVMLIEPSLRLFETYKDKIKDVVKQTCKYPNETLFEYVNNSYFNMPIQYNLSHFLAKPHIIAKYGLSKDDILVFHFNETKFKHIDIIKNPVDESGINWLENPDPKYAIKRNAVLHYKNTVYDKHPKIGSIISKLSDKKEVDKTEVDKTKVDKKTNVEEEDRIKGREYIQQNVAIVEENDEDFGALLRQMKVYQPAFDKLPKPMQDKLHQMDLKDMVKKMKELEKEKEKEEKLLSNKEMDEKDLSNKEMNKKEKVLNDKEKVRQWNKEMDEKEKKEKKEKVLNDKEKVRQWNKEMDEKEKKEKKEKVRQCNKEMDEKEKKWMTRIDDLIQRINQLNTKTELVKFNVDYIEPIVKINENQPLDIVIQDKIKVLTNLYITKIDEVEPVFSPHTPPFPPPPPLQKSLSPKKDLTHKKASSPKKALTPKKASSPKKALTKANKCKDDEEINVETGRCRKVCSPGTVRNEKGKCVKTAKKAKKVNKCKEGEEINPETGRCRKVCPPDKIRNEKGVCVNKTKKNKK